MKTKEQFNTVLNQGTQIRNRYFVLHYHIKSLSTDESLAQQPVDKLKFKVSRLGLIIPKRWAKKAVTRSLIKRQCKAQFSIYSASLPLGDWIIRLRSTFDKDLWLSCSSDELKVKVRLELQDLFEKSLHHLK